jgi:hypothetical protein
VIPYSKTAVVAAKNDQVLYLASDANRSTRRQIDVNSNGVNVGRLFYGRRGDYNHLIFERREDGGEFRLWAEYDYSGVAKITQSPDGGKIRVYHYGVLRVFRNYVTVLNIKNGSVHDFILSERDFLDLVD